MIHEIGVSSVSVTDLGLEDIFVALVGGEEG
jgi:hypothetical protein